MDKEVDIKKLLRAVGYKGKKLDELAFALRKLERLSDIENAYSNTPANICGEDKWLLLKKLRDAAVAPEPAPAPAPAKPAEKAEG